MDSKNTGCKWEGGTKTLTISYKVNLTEKVWTEKERDTLVELAMDKKLRFWDCQTKTPDTKEARFLKNMEYDPKSGAIVYTGIVFISFKRMAPNNIFKRGILICNCI